MSKVHAETVEAAYQQADAWRYERFLGTVEQLTGLTWNSAERAARATMQTLGERLSFDQARELAAELPAPLRDWLVDVDARHLEFDVGEFIRRVAEREKVDEATAGQHARDVLVALARLVRGKEIERLVAHLPAEYERLLRQAEREHRDPSMPAGVVVGDVFIERVARHAALDPREARRAAEAVLETLAERLAGGEVDDLAEQLPLDLHPALERGEARSAGKAQRMSLDEFVWRIAEREGVGYEQALEHARAVFTALRESISDKELSDVLSELPRAYSEALL